jgi:hypothetical protein
VFAGIGLIAFCCIVGGGLIGLWLGRLLPESHKSEATQRVAQSTTSVVAVLSALVLGLLINSTKASLDLRSREIEQFSVSLTLLDRELAHLGPELGETRAQLRAYTERKIALTWPKDRGTESSVHDPDSVKMLDDIEQHLRGVAAPDGTRRLGVASALQLVGELKRTSRLLVVQQSGRTPLPFLVVAIFWLGVLAAGYMMFAPPNTTVIGILVAYAFAFSIAVNLIFDMDHPFTGFIKVSSTPMQRALEEMTP